MRIEKKKNSSKFWRSVSRGMLRLYGHHSPVNHWRLNKTLPNLKAFATTSLDPIGMHNISPHK